MCERLMSTKKFKCGHDEDSEHIKRCATAIENGWEKCSNVKDVPLASSKQQDDCKDCRDEGYSRT